jgi:hypothetical protein
MTPDALSEARPWVLARPRAQEIGTSYLGKEDQDALDDVLRTVLRRAGQRCGFEPCLSGRPFTAVTMHAMRPGAFTFGSGDLTADLGRALALLGEFGWTAEELSPDDVVAAPEPPVTALVGPVPVGERWALPESRLADAATGRFLLVHARARPDALRCFDPMFGGFVTLAAPELAARDGSPAPRVIVLRRGGLGAKPAALARLAWERGADWRRRLAGPTRDAAGLRALAEHAADLSAGAGGFRLRYGLRQLALRAMQLACLLGHADEPRPTTFATADLLYACVTTCREAMAASLEGAHESVRQQLRTLARLQDLLTELAGT